MGAGTIANKTIWTAARALLKVVSPVQNLVAKTGQTHNFCNYQGVSILQEDGLTEVAGLFRLYLPEINDGVHWADASWKSSGHFYDASTGKGFGYWVNGAQECRLYFSLAAKNWRLKQSSKAMFYFGAAVHLVQDLCVPHHAKGLIFDGHQEYEDWAEAHCRDYTVKGEGIYQLAPNPEGWVSANALISGELLGKVKQGSSAGEYHEATTKLLPLAQRTTAGFMAFFYDRVIKRTRMWVEVCPDKSLVHRVHPVD